MAFDPAGNMVPVLAREVPSVQNGGLTRDGTAVTWKLKRGVQWHDGKPFTAQDVVFNWDYAADPATVLPPGPASTRTSSRLAQRRVRPPVPAGRDRGGPGQWLILGPILVLPLEAVAMALVSPVCS